MEKKYLGKIQIIKHTENIGIAYSINEVLQLVNNKYDLLLTMDQDSCFYNNSMKIYKNSITEFDWTSTLGIGPCIVDYDFVPVSDKKIKWVGANRLITSGNIISVSNALAIGAFSEDFFIDEVDFDFCYKGLENNYKLFINTSGVYLLHKLGDTFKKNICGCKFSIMNHNKIRKYYIFRNRLEITKRHWKILGVRKVWRYSLKPNLQMIFHILFFEHDKLNKLRYCAMGLSDFANNRLGKKF